MMKNINEQIELKKITNIDNSYTINHTEKDVYIAYNETGELGGVIGIY